jgi:RNA recognition motif-containing protein
MAKKLYVGNLPYSIKTEQLNELFSTFGEIESAEVVVFKDTGKSKGFGFVSFKEDAPAEKARTEMNGKEVEGRKLVVNEATPFDPSKSRDRPRRSFGENRGFGGERRFNRREF